MARVYHLRIFIPEWRKMKDKLIQVFNIKERFVRFHSPFANTLYFCL